MTKYKKYLVKTMAGIILGAGIGLQLSGTVWSDVKKKTSLKSDNQKIVWLAEIRGSINPATASYLEKTIQSAEQDNAQAVILEMDTPGGLLSSTRTMAQAIDKSSVPVVIFVTPAGASATSAGALLMLASHIAVMSPGTNVGAAHPVGPQGKDVEGAMGEKVVNDTAAFARGLAEIHGRNVKLAEQVVSKSKSLTSEEALKEKFISLLANNRADLFKKLDGYKVKIRDEEKIIHTEGAVVKTSEMSFGQLLLHYLANPNIAAVLMGLGMLLIYIEVSHPGITVAGVLGGICILTAFIAFQVLPIRVGGLALIVLGMILMAAEPFAATGGILAGGGLLSFLLGVLWVLDPAETDLRISPKVWVPLIVGMGTGLAFFAIATARMRKMSRKTLKEIGGAGAAGLEGYRGKVEHVEDDGIKGKILVRGEYWNFESEEPVKNGDWVEAVRVVGLLVVVKPVDGPN